MKNFISLVLLTCLFGVASQAKYTELNNYEAFKKVIDSPESAIIDVYAPWCGACKSMEHAFTTIAEKYSSSVNFYKLNGDATENQQVLSEYSVEAFPTLLIKTNNQPIEKKCGALSESSLEELVKKIMSQSDTPKTKTSTSEKKQKQTRTERREQKRSCKHNK